MHRVIFYRELLRAGPTPSHPSTLLHLDGVTVTKLLMDEWTGGRTEVCDVGQQ